MDAANPKVLDHRYLRFEAIPWWDQSKLAASKVLVIGAGALGNEVLKNLALLGVGNIVIVDMDRVESSNLSRSILFREEDVGRPKAESAASRVMEINHDVSATPMQGNVLSSVGLGYFLWADAVVGALDNREARLFVNAACAKLCKHWIDGGIDALNGIVRGFSPPRTACYECTMSRADWKLVNQRRSCSLLARHAAGNRGTPTTPTTASVIGGIQAQEVVKIIHGLEALAGRGFFFEGQSHSSYTVSYEINPECLCHGAPESVVRFSGLDSDSTFGELIGRARSSLGGCYALDFSRQLVRRLDCVSCGSSRDIWMPEEKIAKSQILCPTCSRETVPEYVNSAAPESDFLSMTPRSIGLPERDIIWARFGESGIGIELSDEYIFESGKAKSADNRGQ